MGPGDAHGAAPLGCPRRGPTRHHSQRVLVSARRAAEVAIRGYASSAYGYSQAIDGTWEWYRDETGKHRAKRTDFADAADFIGWYTNRSRRVLGISQGDAYNQYLAYHEGHAGFLRGSYRRKRWLQRYARQLDHHARTYANQLSRCQVRS
jgi:hypothetical protein